MADEDTVVSYVGVKILKCIFFGLVFLAPLGLERSRNDDFMTLTPGKDKYNDKDLTKIDHDNDHNI